jgi:hypothetical protein
MNFVNYVYKKIYMWNINTPWFDVSVITCLVALGSIFLGHFETETPKLRKVLKLLVTVAIMVTLSATVGRIWAFTFLGIMILAVLYIHIMWLPSKGINGWTGEPRKKYYELRGRKWKE